MALVHFTPVTEAHRDLLRSWLSTPHAQAWWGNPDDELKLIYAIEDGEHEPFIAEVNGEPIAYIQAWWPTQHPDYPWQHGMDKTTRGIDITIGPEAALGQGYGTLIIKAFAARLFAEGAPRLIIDPDKTNDRAIACYMKAGFTPFDEFLEDDGSTSLLMELLPEDFIWLADRE
jgi:aminoglycoside 6'-N-acetyltransferase